MIFCAVAAATRGSALQSSFSWRRTQRCEWQQGKDARRNSRGAGMRVETSAPDVAFCSWCKCISTSQEIHTARGSFDSVRLAPHCAQDDRELELGRVDTFQKRIASGGPSHAYIWLTASWWKCISSSREIHTARGLSTPFGWRLTALKMTENQNCERSVRLAPHCAQNDRELKFFRAAFRIGVTAGRCPSPRERAAFPLPRTSAPAS